MDDDEASWGPMGGLNEDYSTLSLYDEQDEELVSNRRKAEEYFAHIDAVVSKYIRPLKDSPIHQLPLKQRAPIRVAIIDSGIDLTDPFIRGRAAQIIKKRNWVDHDPDNCHDTYGHGTQVARLLLKVAPAVEIYVAKISRGKKINKEDTGRIAEV